MHLCVCVHACMRACVCDDREDKFEWKLYFQDDLLTVSVCVYINESVTSRMTCWQWVCVFTWMKVLLPGWPVDSECVCLHEWKCYFHDELLTVSVCVYINESVTSMMTCWQWVCVFTCMKVLLPGWPVDSECVFTWMKVLLPGWPVDSECVCLHEWKCYFQDDLLTVSVCVYMNESVTSRMNCWQWVCVFTWMKVILPGWPVDSECVCLHEWKCYFQDELLTVSVCVYMNESVTSRMTCWQWVCVFTWMKVLLPGWTVDSQCVCLHQWKCYFHDDLLTASVCVYMNESVTSRMTCWQWECVFTWMKVLLPGWTVDSECVCFHEWKCYFQDELLTVSVCVYMNESVTSRMTCWQWVCVFTWMKVLLPGWTVDSECVCLHEWKCYFQDELLTVSVCVYMNECVTSRMNCWQWVCVFTWMKVLLPGWPVDSECVCLHEWKLYFQDDLLTVSVCVYMNESVTSRMTCWQSVCVFTWMKVLLPGWTVDSQCVCLHQWKCYFHDDLLTASVCVYMNESVTSRMTCWQWECVFTWMKVLLPGWTVDNECVCLHEWKCYFQDELLTVSVCVYMNESVTSRMTCWQWVCVFTWMKVLLPGWTVDSECVCLHEWKCYFQDELLTLSVCVYMNECVTSRMNCWQWVCVFTWMKVLLPGWPVDSECVCLHEWKCYFQDDLLTVSVCVYMNESVTSRMNCWQWVCVFTWMKVLLPGWPVDSQCVCLHEWKCYFQDDLLTISVCVYLNESVTSRMNCWQSVCVFTSMKVLLPWWPVDSECVCLHEWKCYFQDDLLTVRVCVYMNESVTSRMNCWQWVCVFTWMKVLLPGWTVDSECVCLHEWKCYFQDDLLTVSVCVYMNESVTSRMNCWQWVCVFTWMKVLLPGWTVDIECVCLHEWMCYFQDELLTVSVCVYMNESVTSRMTCWQWVCVFTWMKVLLPGWPVDSECVCCQELVQYYQENSLEISFPGLCTTLQTPYKEAVEKLKATGRNQ